MRGGGGGNVNCLERSQIMRVNRRFSAKTTPFYCSYAQIESKPCLTYTGFH